MKRSNYIFQAIALGLCFLSENTLSGQELSFDNEVWDMGTIDEDGGVVSHIFTMYNNTKEPVVILSASSTCGCTTSEYPRHPIMMGDSAKITVEYDPMNRPYTFLSTVRLLTSSDSAPLKISVKGDVTPREMSLEERFPFDMGQGLRFSANYIPLSYIEHNTPRASSINFINESRRDISLELRAKSGSNSGLLDITYPRKIRAGEQGVINFSYTIDSATKRYGAVIDSFDVYINGKRSNYPFTTVGHITEHFTAEQRESSARATFTKRTIRADVINVNGGEVTVNTTLENTGVSPLIIRCVKADNALKVSMEEEQVIAPAESVEVEITIDPTELNYGMFTKYITITTNDSEQPMQRLRVNGVVEN